MEMMRSHRTSAFFSAVAINCPSRISTTFFQTPLDLLGWLV